MQEVDIKDEVLIEDEVLTEDEGLYFGLDEDDGGEITIDGDNPVFEGTVLEGKKFKFFGIPLDGNERDAVIRKHTKIRRGGRETRNEQTIAEELFVRQIRRWENVHLFGKKESLCTPENKKLFAKDRRTYFIARLINAAFLEPQLKEAEAKEEEGKN